MQSNRELLLELEKIDAKIAESISNDSTSEFEKAAIFLGCGGCFGTQISCKTSSVVKVA